MNRTSLAITALVIVAATAIGFVSTQSAAAQFFNTNNNATQSATQTGTATGGAGGSGGLSGGAGGSATVNQAICQQAAQSGAFGSSNNTITDSSCDAETG